MLIQKRATREKLISIIQIYKPFGNRKWILFSNKSKKNPKTHKRFGNVFVIEKETKMCMLIALNNYTAVDMIENGYKFEKEKCCPLITKGKKE